MTTHFTRTPALVATAAVVACLVLAGCGTETAPPAQEIGSVVQKDDQGGVRETHKKPPDSLP